MSERRDYSYPMPSSPDVTTPPDSGNGSTQPEFPINKKGSATVTPAVDSSVNSGETQIVDRIGNSSDPTSQIPIFHPTIQRRVVGWLVGVKGNCKGVDYRLHEGKNYIGRNTAGVNCEVDVQDMKVSRGQVAMIAFDPKSKLFFCNGCNGTDTLCYLNNEALLGVSKLKIYDRLELGDSVFIFVPLCGDAFVWED